MSKSILPSNLGGVAINVPLHVHLDRKKWEKKDEMLQHIQHAMQTHNFMNNFLHEVYGGKDEEAIISSTFMITFLFFTQYLQCMRVG